MCVISGVMDHFQPVIPQPIPLNPWPPPGWSACGLCGTLYQGLAHTCPSITTTPSLAPVPWPWSPPIAPEDLKKLIEGFKDAKRCAELIDELTKQKDCVDPEKAKLNDRVAELERRLANVEVELSKRAPRAPKKKAKAN